MTNVVVTGSTKGIGRGLAEQFIRRGHNVTVSGRSQADVDKAATALNAIGPGKATGRVCDVTKKADCQALWDHTATTFGRVDMWINNAGRAVSRYEVQDVPEDLVHVLVDGNLKGTIFGSQVAINGFRQQGSGALYNVLGGSFDGKRLTPNMGVYSSTKSAIWRLNAYLAAENKDRNIIIGGVSPGMLITENWFEEQKQMTPEGWKQVRPILNVLCDYVETATPWLTERMLANKESGTRISWMTTGKLLGRFLASSLGRKRDLFSRFGL